MKTNVFSCLLNVMMTMMNLCVDCPLCVYCASYIMEKIDLVLVGAEGVVESGGIINKVRRHFTRH